MVVSHPGYEAAARPAESGRPPEGFCDACDFGWAATGKLYHKNGSFLGHNPSVSYVKEDKVDTGLDVFKNCCFPNPGRSFLKKQ